MSYLFKQTRRNFLKGGTLAAISKGVFASPTTHLIGQLTESTGLGRMKHTFTKTLDIGYYELGPTDGPAVLLLHGFPYSTESYREVSLLLAARGCRVIVPCLRGHGATRFLSDEIPRSGQQGAIGMDVIDLMDALNLKKAVLAGYDWGGRAACVAAALFPERCAGLVSINGYLIQDISSAAVPLAPAIESGLWYQFYFCTARGNAGLVANKRELARVLWERNSPTWRFDEGTFQRHAKAFDNPDFVEVVIHSYRHRLGLASGYSSFDDVEKRLSVLPAISVPTITLDGGADGIVPPTDGSSSASKFTGRRSHTTIAGVGHNLPEEAPGAFANAVWELVESATLFDT